MYNSLLDRSVRGSARTLIIINALVIAAIAGIIAFNWRYYRNYVSGPYDMPRDELIDLASADEAARYYVSVTGDDAFDSGYQEVSRSVNRRTGRVQSERVTASFMIVAFDDRLLMVKSEDEVPRNENVGALIAMPADLRSDFISEVRSEEPELADAIDSALLPVMLDTKPFRTFGTIGLVVMLPLLGLALFNVVRGVQRMTDPQKHPAVRALAAQGSYHEVASRIEDEFRNQVGVVKIGNVTITPSWIISRAGTALTILHRDDIAWVYLKVVQRRVNGIPVGKNYAAIIMARPNASLTINANEAKASEILIEISRRAPWALTGYSAELEQDWKKNRAQVLAAVDQRRAQITQRQQF